MGLDKVVDLDQVRNEAKAEMAQKLTASLFALASSGDIGALADFGAAAGGSTGVAAGGGNGGAAALAWDYEPVWIESPECTACDECTAINANIFEYNDQKQAPVKNPKGGTYKDIVKAAEKCTSGCIHPGTPWNPSEPGLDKLVKRAEKYQ